MAELLPIKKRPSYRLPVSQAFISRISMADNSERSMNNIRYAANTKEKRDKSNITYCVEKKKTGLTISLKRKRVSEGDKENEKPNETSSNHKKGLMEKLQGPKRITKVQKKKTGALIVVKRRWVPGGNPYWELGETSLNNKPNSPPPEVSNVLEKRIREKGGRDIQMVIKKRITETDLNKQQGRLLIPYQQIRKDACFLKEEEERYLNSNKKDKGKNEIRVMVMEPCGVDSEMALVKWSMQSSENYILRTGWNGAVERNHKEQKHLKVDHFIQLWSFRVGPQLWFAIDTDVPSSAVFSR